MPKPVLSDSLFNADNVATAILAEANLQIANSNLGVTDRTSLFTATSDTTIDSSRTGGCYSFNGFMFVNLRINYTSSFVNGDTLTLATISDSDFWPTNDFTFPTISYQGDYANLVFIRSSNGQIESEAVQNYGDSSFYSILNGFYRFA